LLLCYGQGEGYCVILKGEEYCVMGRVKANVLWSGLRLLCYGQGENSMTFYKSFILL